MMQLNIIFPNGLRIEFLGEDMKKLEPVRAPPALQEAKPEQSERAPVLGRTEAPKLEKVTKQLQNNYAPLQAEKEHPIQKKEKVEKATIPGWQKIEIVKLKATGLSATEIAKQLGIDDARRVQGTILQAERKARNAVLRSTAEVMPEVTSEVTSEVTKEANVSDTSNVPDVSDVRPQAEKVAPPHVPPEAAQKLTVEPKAPEVQSSHPKPDPITRGESGQTYQERLDEADEAILKLHKQGETGIDIAAKLGNTLGGAWTPDFVRSRIRKLREEGRT